MRLEKRGSMAVSLSDVISASETGSNHCPGRPAPRLIQTPCRNHLRSRAYGVRGRTTLPSLRCYNGIQSWRDRRASRLAASCHHWRFACAHDLYIAAVLQRTSRQLARRGGTRDIFQRRRALLHGSTMDRSGVEVAVDHAVTAEDCALPSANILFSTVHPTLASRFCASNPFARRLPPRIRLYRRKVPSTRACCR